MKALLNSNLYACFLYVTRRISQDKSIYLAAIMVVLEAYFLKLLSSKLELTQWIFQTSSYIKKFCYKSN